LPEVVVVAPSAFGREAEHFLSAARRRLVRARTALVASPAELDEAVKELRPGDLVLGSIGSELAVEVSGLCARRGLQHVEAGALTERILGTGSVRLTGSTADSVRCIRSLLRGFEPAGLVAEASEFGEALTRALGPAPCVRIEELLEVGVDSWLLSSGSRSLVAALRPPWPERLCAAMSGSRRLERCVGAGSWTRPEVGVAASPLGDRLMFCDVLPAALLQPARLEPGLRPVLSAHLRQGRSVYADLGLAAAELLSGHVLEQGCSLWELDLEPGQTLFGHGFRAGPDGRNVRASKAALRWEDGVLKEVV
jgi:hypothetical protein